MGIQGYAVWVVAGLAGLAVVLAAAFLVRRLLLARSRAAFDCSLRCTPSSGGSRWASGVAAYGAGELHWFRLFSLAPRPSTTWSRGELSIQEFRDPERDESLAGLQGAVVVTCQAAGDELQLAMTRDAYTGFCSWLEAAPPGPRAHVT